MNRRDFLRVTGLSALISILPFEAIAENKIATTWGDIEYADGIKPIKIIGDVEIYGQMEIVEPNYARCEVNMNYDFNDIFIADANTGEQIIIPSSEPLPFSYTYKRVNV